MSTVVAVAIGVAPLRNNGQPEIVQGDYSAAVGRYAQRTDKKGVMHLSGFSPQNGAPFEITVTQDGHVDATVGESYVTFEVSEAI